MEKYKKIVKTTIIDENENITETTKTTLHTIKGWQELTREEKEKEIEKHFEHIYIDYQEYKYHIFLDDLSNLKYDFKNIDFENIYLDSNSQGWWIDSIKGFKYNTDDLEVFGERVYVCDIDFTIRRTIEDFEIEIEDYYIDNEKLEKIKNTKKYKNWVENIKKDIENWVDNVNNICIELGNSEYYTPYNLDNEEDKWFLDNFFEDSEFEFVEEDK